MVGGRVQPCVSRAAFDVAAGPVVCAALTFCVIAFSFFPGPYDMVALGAHRCSSTD